MSDTTDRADPVALTDIGCEIRIARPPYGSMDDPTWSDCPGGVTRVAGRMTLNPHDSESDDDATIARVSAYMVDVNRVADPLDAMDHVGGAAFSILDDALHGKNIFSVVETVHATGALESEPIEQLLIVESIFVEEPYRGQRLGPRLLATLTSTLCHPMNFALVLLSVEPFQKDEEMSEFEIRIAQKKVASSFERVGFKKLRDDIYWLHTAYSGLESLWS